MTWIPACPRIKSHRRDLIVVVAMSVGTISMQGAHRQVRRYRLVVCLALFVAAMVAPACVYSFPFRLQPWKQPVAQHQTTERRRRAPGLSELFGANGSEGSDNVDADIDGADGKSMVKKGRSGPAPVSSFEEMVRKMTNNPEYKVRLYRADD